MNQNENNAVAKNQGSTQRNKKDKNIIIVVNKVKK